MNQQWVRLRNEVGTTQCGPGISSGPGETSRAVATVMWMRIAPPDGNGFCITDPPFCKCSRLPPIVSGKSLQAGSCAQERLSGVSDDGRLLVVDDNDAGVAQANEALARLRHGARKGAAVLSPS